MTDKSINSLPEHDRYRGNKRKFPWGDELRYNAFSRRIRDQYGGRIQKVSVNAGFTCPNRDGTKGVGGCLYCNNDGFVPSYCITELGITGQIDRGISFLSRRYRKTRHYIAYFQAFSNTYAPLEKLIKIYENALDHPMIEGLAISTRPDCVDDRILDYLKELSSDYHVFLEYGIESCYDNTLQLINRGHDFSETVRAIEMAADKGLHCTGHLIFGLPGESRDEMLAQADIINSLPLNAIKFHQLQIVRNSGMWNLYHENPELFNLFTVEEYTEFIVKFIERLDPEIAIDRLCSETPPDLRVGPGWGNLRSWQVQKKIESVLEDLDTWQSKRRKNE